MGLYNRKKPSGRPAKKGSAPPTAEDIQAKADRTAFIEQMAAKAALQLQDSAGSATASGMTTPVEGELGGIHPSRLARSNDPFRGRAAVLNSRNNRQAHRAPDLRGQKRSFGETGEGPQQGNKKQRTLDEIKKLKGPAAMKKEQMKRDKKAAEEAAAPAEQGTDATSQPAETEEPKDKAVDKAARKAAKLARKAAKKAGQGNTAAPTEPIPALTEDGESVGNRKARRQAEKEAKKEEKAAEKAAKKQAKLAAKEAKKAEEGSDASSSSSSEEDAPTRKGPARQPRLNNRGETKAEARARRHAAKAIRKASKKAFQAEQRIAKIEAERERKRLLRQETDVVAKRTRPSSTGAAGSWADGAASSLGEKSAKFMKLMGGGKAAGEVTTESLGAATDNKPDKAVKKARKAEAELEKQFKSGMQAKQSGSRRTGLGA